MDLTKIYPMIYPMDRAKRYPMKLGRRKKVIIACEYFNTVGLKSNGTVVVTGDNSKGQCNVSGWKNIVAVASGIGHTVGLKSDGTVVAIGDNSYGQCNVSGWKNIIEIRAAEYYTVGLKSDGTCVATGRNYENSCNVSGWKNIVAISCGANYNAAGYWSCMTVGLKSDGTVVGVGSSIFGSLDLSGWTDIVQIGAGALHTVGLKSDGTVVGTGHGGYGNLNVSNWKNIIAIQVGHSSTVGLKPDGTVVAVGDNSKGQCNVSDWKNIIAVDDGCAIVNGRAFMHRVGLKSDGTVVAVGDNNKGQCNVSGWQLATYNSCKLGFLKDSTNELYSVVDGSLTKVSDDWTAEENKESIVNGTLCDEIPTMGELNALGQFKIVSFSEEGSQPVTTIKVKQKPQILKPKTLVRMSFDTFAGFKFTSSNSNVLFKVLLTTDLNDYKYYDTETSSWVVSDDFEGKGMTLDELNNLSVEAFQSLVTDSIKKVAFGFYVEFLDAISASTDIEFAVTGVRNGMWQKAVNGTDYQYGYPFNDLLRVIFLTAGDYKINYQE